MFLQIAQLFVNPIGGDGRPVLESYTGAYAVKITIGGKWQVCLDVVGIGCTFSYDCLRRGRNTPCFDQWPRSPPLQNRGSGARAIPTIARYYLAVCPKPWSTQVVIVDDYFPALEASQVDDDNKGLAVGHSYGARELWVSLLEKVRYLRQRKNGVDGYGERYRRHEQAIKHALCLRRVVVVIAFKLNRSEHVCHRKCRSRRN